MGTKGGMRGTVGEVQEAGNFDPAVKLVIANLLSSFNIGAK